MLIVLKDLEFDLEKMKSINMLYTIHDSAGLGLRWYFFQITKYYLQLFLI